MADNPNAGKAGAAVNLGNAIIDGLLNFGGFTFRVVIQVGGRDIGSSVNQAWVKVSGLVSETEPIEYMHGTDWNVLKAPGRTKFSDLELERVYLGSDAFYDWRRRIERGSLELGTVTIEVLDRTLSNVVRTITCYKAWPVKWEMPDLNAAASEPLLEKITLAVADVAEAKVGDAGGKKDATKPNAA